MQGFSELRRAIDGVSERMLTKTLQELEADGMLIRKSYNTNAPQRLVKCCKIWREGQAESRTFPQFKFFFIFNSLKNQQVKIYFQKNIKTYVYVSTS